MPAIVIKNLSLQMHRKLKSIATPNRRSMSQQALLFQGMGRMKQSVPDLPKRVKGRFPMTQRFINTAKRTGRGVTAISMTDFCRFRRS